jgi:hypothetical protein
MARPSLLAPSFAIFFLLAAASVAASPSAIPPAQSGAAAELELIANHGLRAHVETSADQVTLEISGRGRVVSYQVRGEVTETGLKAQFGKLGTIDVAFQPTKVLSTSKPPQECEGEPWTRREGVFSGTIDFVGEREYVRIEAGQAKGVMSVTPNWRCPHHEGPIRVPGPPRRSAIGFRAPSEATREPATLSAFSPRCHCAFAAFAVRDREGRGPSFFYGGRTESREGMKITRGAFAKAGAPAFVFDHAAGTASVRPPQPFTGSGTFKRRANGRALWRSTIRAPLLGADPLSFRGRGFRAVLRRDFPGD